MVQILNAVMQRLEALYCAEHNQNAKIFIVDENIRVDSACCDSFKKELEIKYNEFSKEELEYFFSKKITNLFK
jgi:hypothetical protein